MKKNKKAFTLIEIIVLTLILSIIMIWASNVNFSSNEAIILEKNINSIESILEESSVMKVSWKEISSGILWEDWKINIDLDNKKISSRHNLWEFNAYTVEKEIDIEMHCKNYWNVEFSPWNSLDLEVKDIGFVANVDTCRDIVIKLISPSRKEKTIEINTISWAMRSF